MRRSFLKTPGKASRRSVRLILGLWIFLFLSFPAFAEDPRPGLVMNHVVEAVTHSADAGQKARKWSQRKQNLLDQLRELELKNEWTKFQIERHYNWIRNETQAVALLQERLLQLEEVRVDLDPLIEVLYARLEAVIRNDLPFLEEERNRRLSFLRQELDNSKAGLGHRLGRMLEVLQIEALYGQSVDAKEVVATIDGLQRQVTTFRLGRLALFRVTQDNQIVQRFDKKDKTWITIPEASSRELRKAVDIASKKRVTSVVELPIGTISSLLPVQELDENSEMHGEQ
ncbi:MAG: DUF3450 domain-containing protein [Desulfatiglandales bacterium]